MELRNHLKKFEEINLVYELKYRSVEQFLWMKCKADVTWKSGIILAGMISAMSSSLHTLRYIWRALWGILDLSSHLRSRSRSSTSIEYSSGGGGIMRLGQGEPEGIHWGWLGFGIDFNKKGPVPDSMMGQRGVNVPGLILIITTLKPRKTSCITEYAGG